MQISIHIRRIVARCQNDPKCDAGVKQSNSEAFKNNAEGIKTKVDAMEGHTDVYRLMMDYPPDQDMMKPLQLAKDRGHHNDVNLESCGNYLLVMQFFKVN